MTENSVSDVRFNTSGNGMVYFASDVVATIAGLAVTEVEGVANTVSGSGTLADIFARRGQNNTKNLTRGIKVEIQENCVSVDVTMIVEYGSPVPEVAQNIQENVKKAIETMTGMEVKSVDVHVMGVSFERENREVAELEMQQRNLLENKGTENLSAACDEDENDDAEEEQSASEDNEDHKQEEEKV